MSTAETNIDWLLNTWRPSIEGRVAAVEARPTPTTPSLVFKGRYAISVTGGNSTATASVSAAWQMCSLGQVNFGSTSSNHGWGCNITGSPGAWVLTASAIKGSTTCNMVCFNVE